MGIFHDKMANTVKISIFILSCTLRAALTKSHLVVCSCHFNSSECMSVKSILPLAFVAPDGKNGCICGLEEYEVRNTWLPRFHAASMLQVRCGCALKKKKIISLLKSVQCLAHAMNMWYRIRDAANWAVLIPAPRALVLCVGWEGICWWGAGSCCCGASRLGPVRRRLCWHHYFNSGHVALSSWGYKL